MAARFCGAFSLLSALLSGVNGAGQTPLSQYAMHSSPPEVVTRNADKQPSFPPWLRLKYTHITDPFSLDVDNTQYPVLELGNLSYWAASYVDNRVSYNILAYTSSGQLWNACEFPGARYLYAVDIDQYSGTASFVGQVGQTVTVSFTGRLFASFPAANCILTKSSTSALAFNDNRESFAILAYDAAGHLVSQFELPGARYIYQITVANGVATFIGQVLNSVAVPLDTLRNAASATGTLRAPLMELA